MVAVRAGLSRGRTELRNTFTNAQDLWTYFFPDRAPAGRDVLHAGRDGARHRLLARRPHAARRARHGPGVSGLLGVAGQLAIEREDGTLLRAKAIPNGMLGYLIGKIVSIAGDAFVGLLLS